MCVWGGRDIYARRMSPVSIETFLQLWVLPGTRAIDYRSGENLIKYLASKVEIFVKTKFVLN